MTCLQAVSRGNASVATREGPGRGRGVGISRAPRGDPHPAYLEPAQQWPWPTVNGLSLFVY